jgi:hypothetical protein
MKRLIAMTVLVLLVSRSAHAYLDPGTGSMLVQGLLAALAVASATVAAFWTRIVQFFRGRRHSGRPVEKDDPDSRRS